jgi:Dolichyl-phosphate-mannose-protein mannosyltransferase
MRRLCLFATLAAALLLRLPGIEWGLPPATPQVKASDFRSSYAFDEDDILSGAAKADVRRFDFDPHEYHWGTLHIELVLLALDGAQAMGFFGTPWRQAYYSLTDGEFVRVYVVGRLVAVASALLTVWLLFQFPGVWAGPFAAMLVAVSPSHMLQSDQVRVDVTMTAMLVLTLLVGIRMRNNARAVQFLLLGIAGGLAIAGKYSAVSGVAAIVLAALWLQGFPWRGLLTAAAGVLLGFIAGAPYILVKPMAFYSEINKYATMTANVPAAFAIPYVKLMEMHTVNLVRFSLGLPAFLLAVVGIIYMLRRRSPFDWMILAAVFGYALILPPLRWPLIRYDIPLVALLGLCAGVALEQLPKRWRYGLTAVALVMPLCGIIAQIHYMRSPHPANLMLQRILEVVPPGNAISRLMREAPPLDLKIYPLGPNILLADLTKDPPPWALTTDLVDEPYRPDTLALLHFSYDQVANFESRRILGWATFGEAGAPHDWKYTHMSFTLYRRKSP